MKLSLSHDISLDFLLPFGFLLNIYGSLSADYYFVLYIPFRVSLDSPEAIRLYSFYYFYLFPHRP